MPKRWNIIRSVHVFQLKARRPHTRSTQVPYADNCSPWKEHGSFRFPRFMRPCPPSFAASCTCDTQVADDGGIGKSWTFPQTRCPLADGGIAQLVERFVRNEEARGSDPLPPPSAKWLPRLRKINCVSRLRCANLPFMRLLWLIGLLAFTALRTATYAFSPVIEILPERPDHGVAFEITSEQLANGDMQFTVTISPKFSIANYGTSLPLKSRSIPRQAFPSVLWRQSGMAMS